MAIRNVRYQASSTQKLYQLTGECDRERSELTLSRTASRFGVTGTDLGSNFEHNQRIYFLFGDTGPQAQDSIAYTEDGDPEAGIQLQFVTELGDPSQYLAPTTVPPISLGAFEVPAGGFSANGKMYVFFTTDHFVDAQGNDRMGRSVLASSVDSAQSPFQFLYDFSNVKLGGRFINVSPVIVDNATVPGLPDSGGQGLLVFGTGLYRASNPYLVYLPLGGAEDPSQRRYFAGRQAASHRVCWSTRESNAMALFTQPQIGEFSVTWNSFLRLWLMLYNASSPRGINFRVAENPWGPWSETTLLFDPWIDKGYCHFMHVSWDNQVCDCVFDPGRATDWGGEYGPYVISKFSKGTSASTTIYFVMSTWNPYNTVLMKSTLALTGGQSQAALSGDPVLVQSRFGTQGNFEVIAPAAFGGVAHYWRNNDDDDFPWSAPTLFGQSLGAVDAVSMIQSNFGSPGNLEVVARCADRLSSFWRDSVDPFAWHGPYPVTIEGAGGSCGRQPVSGVSGNPVLIQSRFGTKGNFELIVPRAAGGLAHYFRNNDDPALPWFAAPVVAQGAGVFDAVTIIQSNFGVPGNLEVIARQGGRLLFFWRDSTGPLAWHGPFDLVADGVAVAGVAGNPVLIQGRFGTKGNFELIVPLAGGGFATFWRDNDSASLPWHGPLQVEVPIKVAALSLVESNFGVPGNLEMVARVADQLTHSWRDSGPQFVWSGPFDLTSM
jgi:hypothetical protein